MNAKEIQIDTLKENYHDENGNMIEFLGNSISRGCTVIFEGSNNRLTVGKECNFNLSVVHFMSNDCTVKIGSFFNGKITFDIGSGATAIVGDYMSCQTMGICAREGGEVRIGQDCMFASSVLLLQSDTHPIFDVVTKERVNTPKNITVGNHVWLGNWATLLGGAYVADGSIIGAHSTVTGYIPNNAIAVGVPARVTRKNVCWSKDVVISRQEKKQIDDCENVIAADYQRVTEDC